jgi:hypothetical protein
LRRFASSRLISWTIHHEQDEGMSLVLGVWKQNDDNGRMKLHHVSRRWWKNKSAPPPSFVIIISALTLCS